MNRGRHPRHAARTPARSPGWALALLLGLAPAGGQADPMRPLGSDGARTPAARAPGPGGPAGDRPAGEAPAVARPAEPRLVAIRQDSEGRWHALFDERWLSVGQRLGSRTIAAIDAGQVQLVQGRQRQTLHLLPVLATATPVAADSGAAGPSRPRSGSRRATDISTARSASEATP